MNAKAAGQRRPTVAVLMAYALDPGLWEARYERGEVLDRMPYGYDSAGEWFDLRWCRSHPESAIGRRIRAAVTARLGFDLVHVWRNRRTVFTADAIWTHTEREHLAVAMLQIWRRPRRRVPTIAQSVWLWDDWAKFGSLRRRLFALLLQSHAVELLLSPSNRDVSASAVPGRQVVFIPFGSASAATTVGNGGSASTRGSDRRLIVAVGNDIHRDWNVLARVARRLPDVRFRVASRSSRALSAPWPANVVVAGVESTSELQDLYRQASAIVVPLRENLHASGVTACIEALDFGRPLIVTDTGGTGAYFADVATLVAVGDADGLTAAIDQAINGELAAPPIGVVACLGLEQGDYVRRFVSVTRSVLADDEIPIEVSAFAPVALT